MIEIYKLSSQVPWGSNCYILHSSGDYAVVDPSVDYSEALSKFPDLSGRLSYILLTHAHFDHFNEIDSWVKSGARVLVGAEDAEALSDPIKNCYQLFLGEDKGYFGNYSKLHDNQVLLLGDDEIRVISTPGHTPGAVCFSFDGGMIVGDLIFADCNVGRADLPGGDYFDLKMSVSKLLSFKNYGMFYSGHGPLGDLRKVYNYYK